jgi:3-hydroxyisobutyrate dehydrogenase
LKHIAKDLRLARESGLSGSLGEAAFKTFSGAEPDFGEEDIISVIKYISE